MKTLGLATIGLGLVVVAMIVLSRGTSGARDDRESRASTISSDEANQDQRGSRGERPKPLVPEIDPASDATVKVMRSREVPQPPEDQAKPGFGAQARVRGDRQSDSAAPDKFELLDARTAIGRPFPVSPSVERDCMRTSRPETACIATQKFLAELSNEPRNIPWASEQERRLEAGIVALGPDKFAIRSIECRSTRCAVEVAATDVYVGDIHGDPELEHNLRPRIATFGLEKGPNGERIVVTVFTFEQR